MATDMLSNVCLEENRKVFFRCKNKECIVMEWIQKVFFFYLLN